MPTSCLLPPDIRCFVPCGGSRPNPRAWNGAAAHRAMSWPRTRSGCAGAPRAAALFGLLVSAAASATAARSCGFQDPPTGARGGHALPSRHQIAHERARLRADTVLRLSRVLASAGAWSGQNGSRSGMQPLQSRSRLWQSQRPFSLRSIVVPTRSFLRRASSRRAPTSPLSLPSPSPALLPPLSRPLSRTCFSSHPPAGA
jgi:hypothetical protein